VVAEALREEEGALTGDWYRLVRAGHAALIKLLTVYLRTAKPRVDAEPKL